jgi:hypothetical protein
MRKQYEIDDGTSTIEYIQVLLKQFEKCHSSDILPIILKEIQKIPVYMCAEKRYVKVSRGMYLAYLGITRHFSID